VRAHVGSTRKLPVRHPQLPENHPKGLDIFPLQDYVRHVEQYGSECVLQTARDDLGLGELGELKAFIDSMERTYRFRGGNWEDRREAKPRSCEQCGLDLPRGSRTTRRRHDHCKGTARRQRVAEGA
jgi:hypothetical protein